MNENLAQLVRTHVYNHHADKLKECQEAVSEKVRSVFEHIQKRFKSSGTVPENAYIRALEIDMSHLALPLASILNLMGFVNLIMKSSVYSTGESYVVEIPEVIEGAPKTMAQTLFAEHLAAMKQIEDALAKELQQTIAKVQPFATPYAELVIQHLKNGTFTSNSTSDDTFALEIPLDFPDEVNHLKFDEVKVLCKLVEDTLVANGLSEENGFTFDWQHNNDLLVITMST